MAPRSAMVLRSAAASSSAVGNQAKEPDSSQVHVGTQNEENLEENGSSRQTTPRSNHSGSDVVDTCCICLSEIHRNSRVIYLPACGHFLFHEECFLNLLATTCPMCRASFQQTDNLIVNYQVGCKLARERQNTQAISGVEARPPVDQRRRRYSFSLTLRQCHFVRKLYNEINSGIYENQLPDLLTCRHVKRGQTSIYTVSSGEEVNGIKIFFKRQLHREVCSILDNIIILGETMGIQDRSSLLKKQMFLQARELMRQKGLGILWHNTKDSLQAWRDR